MLAAPAFTSGFSPFTTEVNCRASSLFDQHVPSSPTRLRLPILQQAEFASLHETELSAGHPTSTVNVSLAIEVAG